MIGVRGPRQVCEPWIPADDSPLTPMGEPPELQVEIEGCVVGGLSLLEALPCAGLLSGPGVELHVESVSLEARERASLLRVSQLIHKVA